MTSMAVMTPTSSVTNSRWTFGSSICSMTAHATLSFA
jgi:hypothetical protein